MYSPSYSFIAGDWGNWEVESMVCPIGQALEPAPYMDVRNEYVMRVPVDFRWLLRGVSSQIRPRSADFSEPEMVPMPQMGRNQATCAAFIALKKRDSWWNMSMAEKSQRSWNDGHLHASLPRVARQFHYSRELGEPFDFLTWFEYPPEDKGMVDKFLASFRESDEWQYVEREVDLRLVKRSNSW